mgnify:FL=1
MWSILAIYINPETREIPGQVAPLTPNDNDSYFINNLLHKSSFISCKRLSIEEWATSRPNPFEDGYDGNQICDELKRYAYLNPINYENTNVRVTAKELEVRPSVNNDNLTVFWVKKPGTIDTLADNIEYPESVFQLLFNKSLNYISYKQGDNTTIHSVTDKDIALLLNVI